TLLYKQKYCKKCLLKYIKKITKDNICLNVIFKDVINKYLDVQVCISNNQCNEHKSLCGCTKNIQECYENFIKISHFKQIITNDSFNSINIEESNKIIIKNIEGERNCKL